MINGSRGVGHVMYMLIWQNMLEKMNEVVVMEKPLYLNILINNDKWGSLF